MDGSTPGPQSARATSIPVHPGHPDVEADDVRAQVSREGQGLRAVRGDAHDLDVRLAPQQRGQAGPDEGLVVGDDHPDHAVSLRTEARTCQPPAGVRP